MREEHLRKLLWDNAVKYYRRYGAQRDERLRLLRRKNKVLAILARQRVSRQDHGGRGVEACFVGTSITGAIHRQPDLGIHPIECVEFAGWITRGVEMPVILDGAVMAASWRCAVWCRVHQASLAGHPMISHWTRNSLPGQRVFRSFRDDTVTRYRVAIDAGDEIDPDFIIAAQCARNAVNGEWASCWRGFGSTKAASATKSGSVATSVAEIKRARKVVKDRSLR